MFSECKLLVFEAMHCCNMIIGEQTIFCGLQILAMCLENLCIRIISLVLHPFSYVLSHESQSTDKTCCTIETIVVLIITMLGNHSQVCLSRYPLLLICDCTAILPAASQSGFPLMLRGESWLFSVRTSYRYHLLFFSLYIVRTHMRDRTSETEAFRYTAKSPQCRSSLWEGLILGWGGLGSGGVSGLNQLKQLSPNKILSSPGESSILEADPPPPCSACWDMRSTSGRYASYWNAILLEFISTGWMSLLMLLMKQLCNFWNYGTNLDWYVHKHRNDRRV